MKYAGIILSAYLLLTTYTTSAQGSSCSNAINIPLDGVLRTYATSSSTGGAVVCTYSGNSPVTWFSFTTNSAASCPLLNITASDNAVCEVALYTACNGGNILQTASSMCFDDGMGLWAPAEYYTIQSNYTYYVRIKTSSTCSIKIAGQSYDPPNNFCSGAFSLDVNQFNDNNACHKPSPEVTSTQLCAFSLENTAFYKYYVASNGVTIINISNIACDNGANNNVNGFQIGFFTGSCNGLNPIYCTSGNGSFVQATTPVLNAGTLVYVAIDGNGGANCSYSLQAINALGALSASFKNFSAWQKKSSNLVTWTSANDTSSAYFVIERSADGSHFSSIGNLSHYSGTREYNFEDPTPFPLSYYRLRQIDHSGKIAVSRILEVKRQKEMRVEVIGTASTSLNFKINAPAGILKYHIVNAVGQLYATESIAHTGQLKIYNKDISYLPKGQYFLILESDAAMMSTSFIKLL